MLFARCLDTYYGILGESIELSPSMLQCKSINAIFKNRFIKNSFSR